MHTGTGKSASLMPLAKALLSSQTQPHQHLVALRAVAVSADGHVRGQGQEQTATRPGASECRTPLDGVPYDDGADNAQTQGGAQRGRGEFEQGRAPADAEAQGALMQLAREVRDRAANAGVLWSDGLDGGDGRSRHHVSRGSAQARARAIGQARPIYDVVCDDLKLLLAHELGDSGDDETGRWREGRANGREGQGSERGEAGQQLQLLDGLSQRVKLLNAAGKLRV